MHSRVALPNVWHLIAVLSLHKTSFTIVSWLLSVTLDTFCGVIFTSVSYEKTSSGMFFVSQTFPNVLYA